MKHVARPVSTLYVVGHFKNGGFVFASGCNQYQVKKRIFASFSSAKEYWKRATAEFPEDEDKIYAFSVLGLSEVLT